jgi:excisionase family DNA binding protein
MKTSWGDLVRARLGMTPGDLFTPAQAADVLGLSPKTVRGLIRAGGIPATDVHAGCGKPLWRATRADILGYVDKVEARA